MLIHLIYFKDFVLSNLIINELAIIATTITAPWQLSINFLYFFWLIYHVWSGFQMCTGMIEADYI